MSEKGVRVHRASTWRVTGETGVGGGEGGGMTLSHLVWEVSEKGAQVHTASTWKVTREEGGGKGRTWEEGWLAT